VTRKNGKVCTKFTKGNKTEKENTKKGKLTYAQYGERTKPPAMQIEGKSNVLRLQPHIGDGLNPINHLKNGASFALKQPVVPFQISQTVACQITCKIERRFFPIPPL